MSGFANFTLQDGTDGGAFQEYVLIDAGCCAKIPESVSFEEGCLLPMAVATSGVAIFSNLGVPRHGLGWSFVCGLGRRADCEGVGV